MSEPSIGRISIVVPVYNEAGVVDGLFRTLAEQSEVALELIICDGGSVDNTVTKIWALSEDAPFPVSIIHSGKGRGRQLNAGAAASSRDSPWSRSSRWRWASERIPRSLVLWTRCCLRLPVMRNPMNWSKFFPRTKRTRRVSARFPIRL